MLEHDTTLKLDEFATLVHCSALAVAVSGGSDSMALLRLVHSWGKNRNLQIVALTVDHNMRPTSFEEAEQVARWCGDLGVEHYILPWHHHHSPPHNNRQAKARDARYALLTQWCRDHAVPILLLAHHANDQLETFLYRLSHGAGLDGLASMRDVTMRSGVHILRPLLFSSKNDILDYLCRLGQKWIDDPSNDDPSYARTKIRAWIQDAPDPDLLLHSVQGTIENIQNDADWLHALLHEVIAEHVSWLSLRGARIATELLCTLPRMTSIRIVRHILTTVSGDFSPIRTKKIARFLYLLRNERVQKQTLHGCLIQIHPHAGTVYVFVVREWQRIVPCTLTLEKRIGARIYWDNYWFIQGKDASLVAFFDEHQQKEACIVPFGMVRTTLIAQNRSSIRFSRSLYSWEKMIVFGLPLICVDGDVCAIPHNELVHDEPNMFALQINRGHFLAYCNDSW